VALSETTFQRASDGLAGEPVGIATVRGMSQPVAIHSPVN
jgi:hypothetical protein